MNARWKKELLLLAPAWTAAMLVAWGAPQLGRVLDSQVAPFLLFGLVIPMLAVAPFGREHSLRTFSLLLSGPVSRVRLWQEKVAVLALAALTVALCFWANVCWLVPSLPDSSRLPPEQLAWLVGVMTAVACGGGLWASLTVQNFTAAILQTVLMPVSVLLVDFLTLATLQSVPAGEFLVEHQWGFATALLGAYAIAGAAGSRRYFLRAEATPGFLEREIEFHVAFARPRQRRTEGASQRNPRATWALVAKELHLQQFILLGAAVGAGLGLVLFGLAAVLNEARREEARELATGILVVLAFTCPWLAGGIAIAEERRWGTLDAQQCLPVSQRLAFIIKLVCTAGVSVVTGLVIIGMFLAFAPDENSNTRWELFEVLLGYGVVYPLAAVTLAFYASSATSSSLQALGLAVVVGALFCLAPMALPAFAIHALSGPHWDLRLPIGTGLVIGLAALWWRSWRNYVADSHGWRTLCYDGVAFLLVVLAALVLLFELSVLL